MTPLDELSPGMPAQGGAAPRVAAPQPPETPAPPEQPEGVPDGPPLLGAATEAGDAWRSPLATPGRMTAPQGFGSDVADSFMESGVVRWAAREIGASDRADWSFDPFRAMRERGLEADWRELSRARNAEEFDYRAARIDEDRERARRQEASSSWLAPVVGGLLQPESVASMLFLPGALGVGFIGSALRVGAANAAFETGAEVLRRGETGQTSLGGSALRVGSASVFAGLMGGVAGALGGRAAARLGAEYGEDVAALHGIGLISTRQGDLSVQWKRFGPQVPVSARRFGVWADTEAGLMQVDDRLIREGFEARAWRDLGLADAEVPTPNHWSELAMRIEGTLSERKLPPIGAEDMTPAVARKQAEAISDGIENYRAFVHENRIALRSRVARAVSKLADSPYKRVHQRAMAQVTVDLIDGLAADAGLAGLGHVSGRSTGASVATAAKQWEGLAHGLKDIEDRLYEAHLGFTDNPRIGDVPINKSFRRTRANGRPAMPLEEFRRRAAKAWITGEKAGDETVDAYAAEIGRFFGEFRRGLDEVGLLHGGSSEVAQVMLDRAEARVVAAEADLAAARRAPKASRAARVTGAESRRTQAVLDRDLARARLAQSGGLGEDYFSRVWMSHAISRYPKTFRKLLARQIGAAERATLTLGGETVPNTPENLERVLDELVEGIVAQAKAGDTMSFSSKGASFLKERSLPLKNEDLIDVRLDPTEGSGAIDFIETDPMLVAGTYTQRVAPWIEYARRYGDPTGRRTPDEGFEAALDQARTREGEAWAKAHGSMKGFEDHWAPVERDVMMMRDRVTNRIVSDPGRLDNRVASVLRNMAHVTFLGNSALSSLSDAGTLVMAHGLAKTQEAALGLLTEAGRTRFGLAAREARRAGALSEVALGTAMRRVGEVGFDAPGVSRAEHGLRALTEWSFLANGLAPMTYAMKSLDGALRQEDLMRKALAWGRGELGADGQEFLARYGIDQRMAKRILAEADAGRVDVDPDSGAILANADAWEDAGARRAFRAALSQGIDNTIITASAADRPAIFQGVLHFRSNPVLDRMGKQMGWRKVGDYWRVQSGLAGLPFQFWTYALAATNKITAATLERPTGRAMVGVLAMLGLGWISTSLKTPDAIEDKIPLEDKLVRVLSTSGVAGLTVDVLQKGQGLIGALTGQNPLPLGYAYGREPELGSTLYDLLGAGPAVAGNAVTGAVGLATGEPGAASRLSWAVPFRSHPLVSGLISEMVDAKSDTRPALRF